MSISGAQFWRLFTFTFLFLASILNSSQIMAQQADSKLNPKGVVLLLGVKTYKPGSFDNLINPCEDIRSLEEVLRERLDFEIFDEMTNKCDLTAEEIRTLVIRFHDRLGDYPEGSFGLIYFAGHGISLGGDVLLFGRQARVDIRHIKDRMDRAKSRSSGMAIRPIFRDTAVSVLGDLSPGESAGIPVVIIIDACRSSTLSKDLGVGVAGASIMQLTPHRDTLVAFSAAHGTEAVDQIDKLPMSPYAFAIRDTLLRADGSFSDLFTIVRKKLRGILRSSGTSHAQLPAEINALESSICIGGCISCDTKQLPVTSSFQIQRSAISKASRAKPEAFMLPVQYQNPSSGGDSTHLQRIRRPPSSETLWYLDMTPSLVQKLKNNQLGSMRMDVFWCDYGEDLSSYNRASNAAQLLVNKAKSGAAIEHTMLTAIRVRRLSVDQNAREGYQLASDEIRYAPDSSAERRWTEDLRASLSSSAKGLVPRATTTPTPGYMSVFFCDPKP
jgi:hypothetical protein